MPSRRRCTIPGLIRFKPMSSRIWYIRSTGFTPPNQWRDPRNLIRESMGLLCAAEGKWGYSTQFRGVETVEEQLAIAKRKAGIGPREPVELERFEVVRYV